MLSSNCHDHEKEEDTNRSVDGRPFRHGCLDQSDGQLATEFTPQKECCVSRVTFFLFVRESLDNGLGTVTEVIIASFATQTSSLLNWERRKRIEANYAPFPQRPRRLKRE